MSHRNATAETIDSLQRTIEQLDSAPQEHISEDDAAYEAFKTALTEADTALQKAYLLANYGDDE